MVESRSVAGNRWRLPLLGIILVALFGFVPRAFSQCVNPPNAIVAENCLTGVSSNTWDVNGQGAGDATIQGFATDISVNVGGTIHFKIDTNRLLPTEGSGNVSYSLRWLGCRPQSVLSSLAVGQSPSVIPRNAGFIFSHQARAQFHNNFLVNSRHE
jgi:hypothetical protein